MAAFNEIEKKMEEEIHKEETKYEEHDLVTSHESHPPLLLREPFTWLMITDGENDCERRIFYSITEDRYYVRFVPELKNKHVACCYGGLLVLTDKYTDDCSVLNILTMEKLQLPPLNIPSYREYPVHTQCVMSSPTMDGNCRVIFFERAERKFWSCHLGDNEFIVRESTYRDGFIIRELINFKGKLYALTAHHWNLIASDFSDPDLHHEQVVSGESLTDLIFTGREVHIYLVESCEDLLLIFMGSYDYEVCDVKIFKADFTAGEWVKLETLGDRAIFLGSRNNSFSSPATSVGMKGNAVYWIRGPLSWYPPDRHLYMYDIEDKSISMSLPFPTVGTYASLSWVSFPITFNKKKKPEQKDRSSLFEVPTETNFHVKRGKATTESTDLQIEQRKPQKREETETIDSTIVRKESVWADLSNDLLGEIFSHLIAGDRIAFPSVCRSWYSLSPSRITQPFVLPLKSSDYSSPLLVCPDNKMYHPIHGELYNMDFSFIEWARVRASRDGWLLMDFVSRELFFYNPFTNTYIFLPDCDAQFYYSVYFSAPPTSADCLVVVAALRKDCTDAVYFKKCEEEDWTCRKITPKKESFCFSFCNAVVYKGLYYFLGYDAKLLIINPKNNKVRVIKPPKFISKLKAKGGQQYMLESNRKLIAVFVGTDGSSIYTCAWNDSTSKWEILESLGNIMLFVSRPLSICKRATVSGTGNKIYLPRVVGDGKILFYSLATKRYHTFEMGSSYSNFFASKYYPEYNGWFMP